MTADTKDLPWKKSHNDVRYGVASNVSDVRDVDVRVIERVKLSIVSIYIGRPVMVYF